MTPGDNRLGGIGREDNRGLRPYYRTIGVDKISSYERPFGAHMRTALDVQVQGICPTILRASSWYLVQFLFLFEKTTAQELTLELYPCRRYAKEVMK